MNDSVKPIGPETLKLREGVKSLSQELGVLTGVSGPLYQLVHEVKKSNALAVSNQRRLRYTLAALFLCFVGIVYSLYLVHQTTHNMAVLQEKQLEAFAFAQETDDKVEAAQKAIDEAPKIVADDDGSLKVVATVQVEPEYGAAEAEADEAAPKKASGKKLEKKARKKAKSAMKMVDDVLAGLEEPPPPPPAPKKIEIPIQMEMADLK